MLSLRVLACLLCATVLMGTTASHGQEPRFVRESLQTFVKDPAKLTSLLRGVWVMKSRNSAPKDSPEYRTSWEYWSAIHGYPGSTSPSGTLAAVKAGLTSRFPDDAPLLAGYFAGLKDLVPPPDPPGLADGVWATCEHSTPFFLAWHRMFLYYFERVLRDASGDPGFALPYWDYTNDSVDPSQPTNAPARIPVIFVAERLKTSGGDIDNPLFERRRTPGFGSAVHLDVLQTDVDSTLLIDDFLGFQNSLDGGLHGFIHCAVGNRCLAPYIGLVPFSGNDPVFWHHHANIDRLWDCWMVLHGADKLPRDVPAWMDRQFEFVDEHGSPVSMQVSELFDPDGPIDYTYDNIDHCLRDETSAPSDGIAFINDVGEATTMEVASREEVSISGTDQTFLLANAFPEGSDAFLFAERPSILQPTRCTLRLEGVRIEGPPGSTVQIQLVNEGSSQRAFVGVLSFFADFDHAQHGASEEGRNFVFDVSAQIQQLSAERVTGGGIGVAFVASNGVVGDAPGVDAAGYEAAQLRIRKIAIDVTSTSEPIDLK